VFAITQFVSALLLFLVQPMVGKLILPFLGGTPAVWNTCMLFFQALLLAGYTYAHLLSRWFSLRTQLFIHTALLLAVAAPLYFLRFNVPLIADHWAPPGDANPVPWLLAVLFVAAGLPFFVVSTSAPLLQKWFSGTDNPAAKDPYFLYGASNLGSMLALLSYPTLIEPYLGLQRQTVTWAIAYASLVVLTLGCGLLAYVRQASPAPEPAPSSKGGPAEEADEGAPSPMRRLRWVLLAFVPSSMMLGVTTHITTDIAAIPLLWILPLALYLLSFILVFSRLPLWFNVAVVLFLPLVLIALLSSAAPDAAELAKAQSDWERFLLGAKAVLRDTVSLKLYQLLLLQGIALFVLLFFRSALTLHRGMILLLPVAAAGVFFESSLSYYFGLHAYERILLHLSCLFVVAMVCHGELARTRPPASHLTEFYLLMSLGGVLGGAFNALVAPVAFDRVLEYPLIVVAAFLLVPRFGLPKESFVGKLEFVFVGVLFLGGLCAASYLLARTAISRTAAVAWVGQRQMPGPIQNFAQMIAETFQDEEQGLLTDPSGNYRQIARERNFFGTFVVTQWNYDRYGRYHNMYHGTTDHGMQHMERPGAPLTYFHPTGAIGQLFETFYAKVAQHKKANPNYVPRIGVLGGGPRTPAADAEDGGELTRYENDPAGVRVAVGDEEEGGPNKPLFTYIPDAKKRGVKVEVKLGDARLKFNEAEDGCYDLIFMDAFTSDAVPVHLLTKEAMELYRQKLRPDGILIVNIANRYLKFRPVLGNLAEELGLVAYGQHGFSDRRKGFDKYASSWVVMARDNKHFGDLLKKKEVKYDNPNYIYKWEQLETDPRVGVWTDDYSNLLSVFTW
jgi:hypothetical protein